MQEEKKFKICMLGSSGVGKTSIMKRFLDGTFDNNQDVTLGALYLLKMHEFEGETYQMHLWDTAGSEKYAPLANIYYRDAQVAILVYDITAKESFDTLKKWYEEVLTQGPEDIVFAIVGNKADLARQREVDEFKVNIFAGQIGAINILTSAKDNQGVQELFQEICQNVKERDLFVKPEKNNRVLTPDEDEKAPSESKGRCC